MTAALAAAAPDLPVTLAEVEIADRAIRPDILETPLVRAQGLEALCPARLWLKLETLHPTGAFKERGALNRLRQLDAEARQRGVIAMSAGNHAQGVAYHAHRLGVPARIVMPAYTPHVKVERTAAMGAEVILHGESLDEARDEAYRLAELHGLTFVHPYDDAEVIAGQGSIAMELVRQMATPPAAVVVPIGGGGMIAGMAVALKAHWPQTRLIGVQTAGYPAMRDALAGEPLGGSGATLAEGIAVRQPGLKTQAIVRALVDEILLVTEEQVEDAIYRASNAEGLVVEGAAAAGLAAVLASGTRFASQDVVAILCGRNIDTRILAQILLRGMVRDGRMICLRIALPDVPGALGQVARLLGAAGANIVEVRHHRLTTAITAKQTSIDITMDTRNRAHAGQIIAALAEAGFAAELLEDIAI